MSPIIKTVLLNRHIHLSVTNHIMLTTEQQTTLGNRQRHSSHNKILMSLTVGALLQQEALSGPNSTWAGCHGEVE